MYPYKLLLKIPKQFTTFHYNTNASNKQWIRTPKKLPEARVIHCDLNHILCDEDYKIALNCGWNFTVNWIWHELHVKIAAFEQI